MFRYISLLVFMTDGTRQDGNVARYRAFAVTFLLSLLL